MKRENVLLGTDDDTALYAPHIKRAEAGELAECY